MAIIVLVNSLTPEGARPSAAQCFQLQSQTYLPSFSGYHNVIYHHWVTRWSYLNDWWDLPKRGHADREVQVLYGFSRVPSPWVGVIKSPFWWHQTVITPLLMHWSYSSLLLSYHFFHFSGRDIFQFAYDSVSSFELCSYLTGVTTAELQWHLSNRIRISVGNWCFDDPEKLGQ